jgi:glycolate oxidase iron-sulfur subunit
VCPTYLHLGNEADSPRGRIYLMRAHEEGRQALTPAFREHLDLCLVCRACETACPSGVRFGSMMEEFRALMREGGEAAAAEPSASQGFRSAAGGTQPRWLARAGEFVLRRVLPHPHRLRALANLLWMYEGSGLATLLQRSGLVRALGVGDLDASRPRVPSPSARRDWAETLPAYGRRRARVLFLRGCVTPQLLPAMQRASLEALRHNGCEVVTPRAQRCCGALHFHAGFRDDGLDLLEHNARVFDQNDVDAVVVNAAGCGSTLKEYGELARERPGSAAAAAAFASRVRDISEVLVDLGLVEPRAPVPAVVAYDEPCHLLHGQRVSAAPKQILDAIPGLRRVPLTDADRCCGSAGVYNLVFPRLARQIVAEKVAHIAASGADTVATGNPGCILWIRAGLRAAAAATPRLAGVRVVHPMQLLARAYRSDADLED